MVLGSRKSKGDPDEKVFTKKNLHRLYCVPKVWVACVRRPLKRGEMTSCPPCLVTPKSTVGAHATHPRKTDFYSRDHNIHVIASHPTNNNRSYTSRETDYISTIDDDRLTMDPSSAKNPPPLWKDPGYNAYN
jgi:hypothetical protein